MNQSVGTTLHARKRHRLIYLLSLAWCCFVQGHAQQPLPLDSVEVLGANIANQSGITGMVVVIVRDQEVKFTSYGETAPGSGQRPGPQSVVRLCSLTKVFTTDLLERLILSGSLHLTDPLQQFAPAGVIVPSHTKRGAASPAITLGTLATHTSGLVREVAAYPALTAHFTFPAYDYRWRWLPNQRLLTPPGSAARYSNVAFDFLGDALTKATGKSYEELFREQIGVPLRLRDTTLSPTPEQCARLIRGSEDEGPCTDTHASAGSGGLYSTPADMAHFVQSLLHLPGIPPQPSGYLAMYVDPKNLASLQGLDHAGTPTGIGLGWLRLGDAGSPSMIIEKTGGGAGFTTYIALNPAQHAGIFMAATDGKGPSHGNVFQMVNDLLASVAGVPPLPQDIYAVHPVSTVKHMSKSRHRLRTQIRKRPARPHS
jgi:D-alanyl-D-alanine-carboxypeptidase/D-alanyl-D-alanine-endopeptidase